MRALAGVSVIALAACTSAAPTDPTASSSARTASSASSSSSSAPPSSASASPSASSSAAPSASPFAKPFDPKAGRPVGIYEGAPFGPGQATKRPSGAVFNLPAVFASVTSAFGDGVSAWYDPEPAELKGTIALSIARTKDPLTDDKVGGVCGALVLKTDAWTRVPASPPLEGIWKAKGKGVKNADWEAYAIDAVLPSFRVRGCGGWPTSHPELEGEIIQALSSVRMGSAPPNDINGL